MCVWRGCSFGLGLLLLMLHTCIVSFLYFAAVAIHAPRNGSFNGSILPNLSGLMLERLMSCEKGMGVWKGKGREWVGEMGVEGRGREGMRGWVGGWVCCCCCDTHLDDLCIP